MISTGVVQIIHMDEEVQKMTTLGYPTYFLTIIGIWKILGVVAVLLPKFPLVKEWAYAGFAFNFISATVAHAVVSGLNFLSFFPLIIFGILIVSYVSWHKMQQPVLKIA